MHWNCHRSPQVKIFHTLTAIAYLICEISCKSVELRQSLKIPEGSLLACSNPFQEQNWRGKNKQTKTQILFNNKQPIEVPNSQQFPDCIGRRWVIMENLSGLDFATKAAWCVGWSMTTGHVDSQRGEGRCCLAMELAGSFQEHPLRGFAQQSWLLVSSHQCVSLGYTNFSMWLSSQLLWRAQL